MAIPTAVIEPRDTLERFGQKPACGLALIYVPRPARIASLSQSAADWSTGFGLNAGGPRTKSGHNGGNFCTRLIRSAQYQCGDARVYRPRFRSVYAARTPARPAGPAHVDAQLYRDGSPLRIRPERHAFPHAVVGCADGASDPDIIQDILVEKAEAFGRDPTTRQSSAPVIGDTSLFLAEGADWRWQRRAVAPIFRHEALLSFVPIFAGMAQRQVDRWRGEQHAIATDAAAAMTRTTFEIIVEAMLGGSASLDAKRLAAR